MDIEEFLISQDISFERFEHPPLFTCEDSEKYRISIRGADTKNLFVRDKKGSRYFLVTVGHATRVDLKCLANVLGVDKLSFGSQEALLKVLGVEPGSVTILALLNDTAGQVTVVIDKRVWESKEIQAHPLVNTATLVIPQSGIARFLEVTKHAPLVIEVPSRSE